MGHGNVHWSANFDEIHDFENDICEHFGGSGLMNSTRASTPTLAGIHATAPYFHDGSAQTLSDVFKVAGGTTYQAESGSVSGSVSRPSYISINYFNAPQKQDLVEFSGAGTWSMPNVNGGSGGVGVLEFRFTAGGTQNIVVRVNSTNYPVTLVARNFGW